MTGLSARRRIRGAFVANALVRFIRIAEQLLLVPLLLSAWGAEQFGEWTALTSVASFAFLANVGLGQAGSSDIILRVAAGDEAGAARSFVTSVVLLAAMVLAGCVILAGALAWLDPRAAMSLTSFTAEDGRAVILILALSMFVSFFVDPLGGVLSAAVGAGTPNFLSAIAKGSEIIAIAIAIQFSASPLVVAGITLSSTLLNLVLNVVTGVRVAPWLSFRLSNFDIDAFQRTWKASLAYFSMIVFMTFVYMQVPRLVIFHFFGATALAGFAVLVAYTRAGRMLAMLISQSAQVEIGRAFGAGRTEQFRTMVATLLGTTFVLALLLLLAELLAAPLIVPIWTRGQVSVAWDLLTALALVALVGSLFDALFLSVAAVNRVVRVAVGYGAGLAIGFAAGLALLPWLGPVALAIALIVPEIGGAWAAMRTLSLACPPTGTGFQPIWLRLPWPRRSKAERARESSAR
jgi:O-antigen/teichoic acid export membrane protein